MCMRRPIVFVEEGAERLIMSAIWEKERGNGGIPGVEVMLDKGRTVGAGGKRKGTRG